MKVHCALLYLHLSACLLNEAFGLHKVLPVFDIRTGELFAFPEDFLHMVLQQQWENNRDRKDLLYLIGQVDNEGQ